MYKLIVDTRERQIIPLLGDLPHTVDQITVGDYVILDKFNSIIAVIERKTLKDYASSIKDGRINNNKKMLELREKNGCDVFMIVEGPLRPTNVTYSGIPYKNIQSHIIHSMVRDNIKYLYSKNEIDTAQLLFDLLASLDTLNKQYKGADEKSVDDAVTQLKSYKTSNSTMAADVLSCVYGISRMSAPHYIKHKSIKEYLLGEYDTNMIVNGKKKISKRVIDGFKTVDHAAMLSKVNGITIDTAKIILSNYPLLELLDTSANKIAEIIIGTKKLGNNRAQRILDVFEYTSRDRTHPQSE